MGGGRGGWGVITYNAYRMQELPKEYISNCLAILSQFYYMLRILLRIL